jgi:hypothetical protein
MAKVWRIYKRGEQPWEPWAGSGGASFDAYQYVASTKHDNKVIGGRVFETNYFHTREEAEAGLRVMMEYPWRKDEVFVGIDPARRREDEDAQ